ncbi:unnamed protein product [Symbiodinium sp. CCMP2456]|nr:unnamed protein product [Symbiodinium sp. CCMP2456]
MAIALTREEIIGQVHQAGRLYDRAKGAPNRGVLEQRADQLCVDLAAKIARQIEEEEKQAVDDSIAGIQPATAAVLGSATWVSMPVLESSAKCFLGLLLFGSTAVLQLCS